MTGYTTNLTSTLYTLLATLEQAVGFNLQITSGYRTPEHNKDVGGVENSEHTMDPAHAVDIAVANGHQRYLLVLHALGLGVVRLGIGNTFVHLGVSPDHPQRVIWTYYHDTKP